MQTQWPLVVFTLFVCLTCGTLAGVSVLSLRGKGEGLRLPALILSAAALIIGGIASFLHLEHWERIFNGFGHISSGITQELIGCVVLAVLLAVWFVLQRGGKRVPAALSWVTIMATVLMVVATSHSYMMAARPAWGLALILFYLASAFLLGSIALWALSITVKDEVAEPAFIKATFIAACAQIVADAVFVGACAFTTIYDVGYYADPTKITTAPQHITGLLDYALYGEGAPYFWLSLVLALIVLGCTVLAKKKLGTSRPCLIIAIISVAATSLLFRALIYVLGLSVFLLY